MTPTTMMTTLDVLSPAESPADFSPSKLITPTDSTTSSQNDNVNGNLDASNNSRALVPCTNATTKEHNNNNNNNSYYDLGLNVLSGMFFSCFRPNFWSNNPRNGPSPSHDDWEIPFESIKTLEYVDSGSQAAVFRGKYNGQEVAVKKVKKLEEVHGVRSLMNLKHENIIKFIGVCIQAPCYCIVMEFCKRGTLSNLLKSEDVISRDDWVRWLKEIAQGMLYLHDNRMIHRDLKSPNILVSDSNQIKICDFGTFQVRQDMRSMVMSVCGTVSWMAPEVIRQQNCSEKVDVYSFGVVLWEMLTREKPYKNIEPLAIMYNVGNEKLSLPIPSLASEGTKTLLKQTLSGKPRNRPSFRSILLHIDNLERELQKFDDAMWHAHHNNMREEAEAYEYPVEMSREPETNHKIAELERSRRKVLKHAEDIQRMYLNRYHRVTEMMSMLEECSQKLKLREEELNRREAEIMQYHQAMQARCIGPKSLVARAGPQTLKGERQDISTSIIPSAASYGHNGYDSSSSIEDMNDGADFSRQSSYRSSTGRFRGEKNTSFNFIDRESRAHSEHHHVDNLVRGSPARNSGCSVDSGVSLNYSLSALNLSNQSSSYSISRHSDGRSSDSKLTAKRRCKDSYLGKSGRSEPYQISHRAKERSTKHSNIRRIRNSEQTASTFENDLNRHMSGGEKLQSKSSENSRYTSRLKTDASSESSDGDYDEMNGNGLKHSTTVGSTELGRAKPQDDPDNDKNDENNILTNSNTSAIASSLERALETSDGLSDKEKTIRAASASIRGHRRCYSHPVNKFSFPMDDISADSDEEVDV